MSAVPPSAIPVRLPLHERYSDEAMNRFRQTGDPLADAVAQDLKRGKPQHMLQEVIERAKTEGGIYQEFLDHGQSVPDWVDWDLIEQARRSQLIFSNQRAITLLVSGLAEGTGLNKAADVLANTGRFKPQKIAKRLYETGQMLHNANSDGGLRPGGAGQHTIMEVRLLQAMVRKLLLAHGWDVDTLDVPICQEDMLFTICEFDFLAVRGMERIGAHLPREQRVAIHHFWQYVAWLNGVDVDLLSATPEEEEYLYQRIIEREHRVNATTVARVHELIEGAAESTGMFLEKGVLFEMCRRCLGEERGAQYQLPNSLRDKAVMHGWIRLNRIFTATMLKLPWLADKMAAKNFQMMNKLLLENLEADSNARAFRHIA